MEISRVQFGEAHSGREEQFQDGFVPESVLVRGVGGVQQTDELLGREHLYLPGLVLEHLHAIGRVRHEFLLGDEVAQEGPQDDEVVVLRGDRELLALARPVLVQRELEFADGVFVDRLDLLHGHEQGEDVERLLVVFDGQRGLVLLGLEVDQVPLNRFF
jgi:hypothetical protein